jgi:tetratricopeptide (TPR) repeat protein
MTVAPAVPNLAQLQELERLENFLAHSPERLLIFCLYSTLDDVKYVQETLQNKLGLAIERAVIDKTQPNPLQPLYDLPPKPPRVVFAVYQGNLDQDLHETAGYANTQRDAFADMDHTLVFWLGEVAFPQFVRLAPDFWAWHSGGLFELQGLVEAPKLGEVLRQTEAGLPEQRLIDVPGLQRRAEAYRAILDSYTNPTADDLPYLARTHYRLASVLQDLRQYPEALKHLDQAEALAKQLNNQDLLAQSLNLRGIVLAELGRREEALNPTQEAVDLYRKLAQTNPAAYNPDLAGSLNNLGAMLSELGRREEALSPTQEAVELYRKLAQTNPAAYNPDLAGSLNNLGAMLSDLGRREEALSPTQEAVDIRRKLAQTNPAAFNPDLAASLNNLGIWLSDLGRREEALSPTQEAVDLYRKLAQTNPAAYNPYLAVSLLTLSHMYREIDELGDKDRVQYTDRLEDCQDIAEEGLEILVPYWRKYPRVYNGWALGLARNFVLAGKDLGDEPEVLVRDLTEILGNPEVAMQWVGRFWQGLG